MSFDVVTIGSATVDYFADTDSELIKIETRTHKEKLIAFPLGSKLLIKTLDITTGGGGTNSAVSFTRLGLNTAFLGKVGDDENGDLVINKLKREGIKFIGAREGKTGLSVILDSIEDDRSILAYKGANDHLHRSDIPEFQSQWIYLSSMLEESLDTVIDLLQKRDIKVAFNPSNYQAEMGYKGLKALVDQLDILIMNYEEACKFLSKNYEESPPIQELFQGMAQLPPRIFAITAGSQGAYVYDRQQCLLAKPRKNFKIKETTGAGDAFASTFTAAHIKGHSLDESMHLAMCNAESVLQFKGAKERLLTWQALRESADELPREIEAVQLT